MSNIQPTAGQGRRIVLVEDDAALRRALSFSLRIEGYDVEAMDCGEALLECALDETVVLVIDQILPGLTGLECLTKLRERNVRSSAVLITGGPSQGLAAQAEAVGATVLAKPILGDALIEALRRLDPS